MSTSDLEVRKLEAGDVGKGFLQLLNQLTTLGDVSEEQFLERLTEIEENSDHQVVVAEDNGRVVGAATLLIERKFIHDCGKVAHVEDVVVDENCRGKSLGKRLIENLVDKAQQAGCYKVILDCSDHNVPFYEKCGFERKGVEMAKYF